MSHERIHLEGMLGALARFWSAEGCALLPACEAEMPSALLHPEVFFRLPDREPIRLACLQGVHRPTDGRQGKHPFRLAKYLQFAVFLKPPADDVQQLFLRGLRACGLVLEDHDIRFCEWNWASHVLDGWGAGWRVEIDGLGVARITFLQRLAGGELEPPTVEIAYGVERLLLALTGSRSVFHLPWNQGEMTYGAFRQAEEVELSQEAFENADVTVLRQSLDALAGAAGQALAVGSPRLGLLRIARGLVQLELLEARRELSTDERRQRGDVLRQRVFDAVARQVGGPLAVAPQPAAPQPAAPQPATPQPATPQAVPPQPVEPVVASTVGEPLPVVDQAVVIGRTGEGDTHIEKREEDSIVTTVPSGQAAGRAAEPEASEKLKPKPKRSPRKRKKPATRRRSAQGAKSEISKAKSEPARDGEDEDAD